MRLLSLALVVALLVPIESLSAQHPPPLEPGARVRVTAPDCDAHERAGTFRVMQGDTLVLRTLNCPLAAVTRLDISRGRHRSTVRAVGFGVLGFLGGGLAGCFIAGGGGEGYNEGVACLIGGAIGGGVGLVAGAVVGAKSRDRWEEVPLDRLRVSFAPKRDGGFVLGLSIAF
jgi:hypothetical protein